MANHASHAALPYPIKGARFSLLVPYLDANGDPTDPTTPDTELSKDDGAAADAAEEVASPKNSVGMLTLSGAETDCSCLSLAGKAASGPKTTLATLYPRVLAVVGSGTLSAGSAGGGTLGTLLAYDVTGCFIKTTGGTGGGGPGGANNQARKIITYNTATGQFTVAPNWETTPSTDTTYEVLLPEGVTLGMLKALNPITAGGNDVDATKWGGTVVGSASVRANLISILGTALTETSGQIAAAFKKFFDKATPTGTINSLPDAVPGATAGVAIVGSQMDLKDSPNSTAITAINAAVLTAISNLNNLSALSNLYGSPLLEIPDSSSTAFAFTLVVRDNEGKLVDLDANPTIAAANAAGTSRSANLSAVSHPATGVYRFTYTVASDATAESLRITCTGAVSAEGRYVEWIGSVVNYDSITLLNTIAAKTGNLPSDPADQSQVESAITSAASTLSGLITALNNLSSQQVRDAMKLAPTAGSPAAGSVDKHLDDIEAAAGSAATSAGTAASAAAAAQSAAEAAQESADAVAEKLPTSPFLAGSENEDGSIAVDVGDIDLDLRVAPYSAHAEQRVKGTVLTLFQSEFGFWQDVTAYDGRRAPYDLTDATLRFVIADKDRNILARLDQGSGVLEKVVAANGTWRFKVTAAMCPGVVENEDAHYWFLCDRVDGTRDEVINWGRVDVKRRDL